MIFIWQRLAVVLIIFTALDLFMIARGLSDEARGFYTMAFAFVGGFILPAFVWKDDDDV